MQYPVPAYTTFTIPTGATTGARIVFDGTTGLIKVYNSSNVLVDTIGGPAGDIIQSGTARSVGIQNGFLTFFTPGSNVNGLLYAQFAGNMTMDSGTSGVSKISSRFELNEGDQAITVPGTTEPQFQFFDNTGSSVVSGLVSGALQHSTINGGTEAWQTPTMAANFAIGSTASATYQNIQCRKDVQNNLIVTGALHATAALAAGNRVIFTIPAGYRPLKAFNGADIFHTTAADAPVADTIRWNIAASGSFAIGNTAAFTLNDNLYINACIPLGNIP